MMCSCASRRDVATFVVLPDTQTYLEQCPEIFETQIDWLVKNHKKIDAVLQVGDLTQDNSPTEWRYIEKEFKRLDDVKLPYAVVWGNHDIGSRPGQFSDVHNTVMANRYIRLSDWQNKKYWLESADGTTLDNYALALKAGGLDWLLVNMEFGPSDDALAWADSLIAANKDKKVIFNTHAYLYSDSTLHDGDDWWLPQAYGIGRDSTRTVNDGAAIWEKLLRRHPNVAMAVCGHILKSGVGTLVSTGDKGNKVYQMMANFQRGVEGSRLGGEAYLRIIRIDRRKRRIDVSTYSPYLDAVHPSPHHNFSFTDVDI